RTRCRRSSADAPRPPHPLELASTGASSGPARRPSSGSGESLSGVEALVLDLQEHAGRDVAGRVLAGEARGAHALDGGLALEDGSGEVVERLIDDRVGADL